MEILPDPKKFKIMQCSNSIYTPSGYGVQSKGNLTAWNKIYDVRQLAFYGLEGAKLELNGLQIYPVLPGDDNGGRTAQLIFRTSPWKPDVFVTLYDIWMGAYVQEAPTPSGFAPIHPHWIPIVMVDMEPIPESTLIQAELAYRIVTPTLFGIKEFQRFGVEAQYIPFGTSTDVFKPVEPDEKRKLKPWLSKRGVPFDMNNHTDITEDSFLIFMNGANKDPYRKAYPRMFTAAQIFLENNPDAAHDTRIYVNSWMKQARDIPHTAKILQLQHLCRGTADIHNLCSVPEATLAKFYGAADVFMHLSEGGGFEIPILEALSSGLPVIGSDFVGMTELIKDHGWLVPMKTKYFTALDATAGIADEYKAAEALEDAYNHPDKREVYGKKGREFALGFDWAKVNALWINLFESIRREWQQTPVKERKI